jgi:hypothetical protein
VSEYVDITLRIRHRNLLAMTVTKPGGYVQGKVQLVPGPDGVYGLSIPGGTCPDGWETTAWVDTYLPTYAHPPFWLQSEESVAATLRSFDFAEPRPWWRFWR